MASVDAAAAPPGLEAALRSLRAGIAQRERALALAAQIEQSDYQELEIWERLIPVFPPSAWTQEDRAEEATLRLGVLPLLTTRQRQYRALELDLARSLAAPGTGLPALESTGTQMVRLASIREWSSLVEQAQRQTRSTLDRLHALALARAAQARARPDASALAALGRLREGRVRLEAMHAEAAEAWMAEREAARQDQGRQALATAVALAQAAVDNQRIGDELHRRAAEASLPASSRELLGATARALQATARVAVVSATEMAGDLEGQADSFLVEPNEPGAADGALAVLLVERRGIVRALRTSLAARVATLGELRSLAEQRDGLLGRAGYLPHSKDAQRTHLLLQAAAAQAWRQVGQLREAAGNVVGDVNSERAHAAQALAVQLEELVVLESHRHALAIGRLLDTTPGPADLRLAGAAAAWKRDVDELQALDARWAAWRKGWDEPARREEAQFEALRALVARAHALWDHRVARLAEAMLQPAAEDEIGRLTRSLILDAQARLQARKFGEGELRRLSDETGADPVVSALQRASADLRWSRASAGLRGLPRLFDRLAQLPAVERSVPTMRDVAQPVARRLAALMALSEVLELPWLAAGSGPALQLSTEVAGEAYLLEALGRDAPQLRRVREFFVGNPARLAWLAVPGLQIAQAGKPSLPAEPPGPYSISPDHPMLSPVPTSVGLSPRTFTLIAYHTTKEVFDNRAIYLAMPLVGAASGAYSGAALGPGGSWVGTKTGFVAGVIAVSPAVAEDAAFGGLKGLVKGAAADLQRQLPPDYTATRDVLAVIERNTEACVDGVQGVIGLSHLAATGMSALARQVRPDKVATAERLTGSVRGSIAEGQQRLAELSSRLSADRRSLRADRTLSAADRQALKNAITAAYATADEIRRQVLNLRTKVLPGVLPELVLSDRIRAWGNAAAEALAALNDACGPNQSYASELLSRIVQSGVWAEAVGAVDMPMIMQGLGASALGSQRDPGSPGTGGSSPPGSATDPQGDQALAGYRASAQQRSAEAAQRAAATASANLTRTERRSSAEELRAALEREQQAQSRGWETREGLETLRQMREREQKEKEQKEKEQKDKEQKDKDAGTGEVKTPVVPDKPKVDPLPPEPVGPEKSYWYGYEAVISYKVRGAPCTQTLSGEVFGTRAQAEQAMRDAGDQALRTGTATRTDLKLVSRRLYAGPLTARPAYPGPTGLKAIQCGSAPATATPAEPAVKPVVPAGTYEPKGNGQACPQIGVQTQAQCRQMTEACTARNCSGGGYSGCALDCPGCAGYFGDYTAWCTLHPSYAPLLSSGLSAFLAEIKGCLDQFLADGKPGRRERGAECQAKAHKKLAEQKDRWVQQACQARCAQDGRSGVAVLGGGRHRCECR